jgi:serine/threonine protein kinase/Tfp pilus assembly protein PilF
VDSRSGIHQGAPADLTTATGGQDPALAETVIGNSADPNLATTVIGDADPSSAPTVIGDSPANKDGKNAGPGSRHPVTIGHYRILRLLGEGGMGSVYLAEQENPHRIVALKVIKPGIVNAELLRRFGQEANALGRLQHPGIAQIYEAGTADTGFGLQPYFAMEFIAGQTLLEFAESRHLNSRSRLKLMAKICDAVNHAHQRGLIHRDLKPGNILVDQEGQPKILDFGVARVTDSDAEATRQTDMGQLIGTLAYMSPEQVLADPEELDIRSDVYALGVITYELLAGKLPYDINRKPLHEIVRSIRETDPAKLSSIQRAYQGDIETIVAKALEKDKERRYASAAELAADIRRYLADEPIVARPPSTSYQLKKFAQRNRALVAGAAAVVLVLIVGAVVSTWQAVRARRAEASAKAVSDFLQNDLLAQASAANQSGPTTKPDPDLKVRTALDRAAERITGKFDMQPEVEAEIRDTIGQTYLDLGLYPEARKQLELALALHKKVDGPESPKALNTAGQLGFVELRQGKYAEAEAQLSQTSQAMHRVLGPENPDTLKTVTNLGNVYLSQSKYAQAEALYTQLLETERRVLGPEDYETLRCMNNLAGVYTYEGKYTQAETLFGQTVEGRRHVSGPEHPLTLTAMGNLANIYSYEGKYAQAEALESQTVEIRRRVIGPERPSTLRSMSALASVYVYEGKYSQAEALFSQTLEVQRRVRGPENPDTLGTLASMASMYQVQGKYSLAETNAAQALAGQRHTLGADHPDTMASANDLALAYLSQGKFTECESIARETEAMERTKQPDNWQKFWAESLLGASLAGEKKYAEAEPMLLEGYRGMLVRKDLIPVPNWRYLESAHAWIVEMYKAWGKPEKAAEKQR